MPQRTSPPQRQYHRNSTGAPDPKPVAQPREAREQRVMSEEQRAEWVRWLTEMFMRAGYAVRHPSRGTMFYWKSLERAIGEATGLTVQWYTLINYIKKGSQPSAEIAAALARTLGLHPLSVIYKAGIFSLHDMAIMLGSGHLRDPQDLYAELSTIRNALPEGTMARQNIEARILREINTVAQLQEFLTDEEWGGLQAELVKLEIADDGGTNTYTAPSHPSHLPPPTGTTPVHQPPTIQAGPRKPRVPHEGDVAEE